jgi:Tol biopolymer transport system component
VYLYDLQQRRLISLPGLNQPGSMQSQADISGDGRYIVYYSEQLGKSDIYMYDRSTATSKNLTRNFLGEVRHPSISADGRFVAFEGNRSGQWDIEIYDRGTGIALSAPQNSTVTPKTP